MGSPELKFWGPRLKKGRRRFRILAASVPTMQNPGYAPELRLWEGVEKAWSSVYNTGYASQLQSCKGNDTAYLSHAFYTLR